jgi:excisionase family DNA binding protein
MAMPRRDILPISCPPRGLSREEAAAYLGIGASLFDQLVKEGKMPAATAIKSRRVWDRLRLDVAFDALRDADDDGDEIEFAA